MNFKQFRDALQAHVNDAVNGKTHLFVANVDRDVLWNTYLNSFPPGTNEVYRTRREFDCGCCRAFVKQFGAVLSINEDGSVATIWDVPLDDGVYSVVASAMSELVRQAAVGGVHVSSTTEFGTSISYDTNASNVLTWNHFHIKLPSRFKNAVRGGEAGMVATWKTTHDVFERSLNEISPAAVQDVLEMIEEGVVYRGDEWKRALEKFQELQRRYLALDGQARDRFVWLLAVTPDGAVTRIRNHSIGTLLVDLTEGVEAAVALRKFEAVMAPTSYKRPTAKITPKAVDLAQAKVAALGLLESLPRRFATLADITVANTLWSNRDAAKHMGGAGGVFDLLRQEATVDPRSYEGLPGVGVDDFIGNVLPTASSVEVLFDNGHAGNLVSLVAPANADAPSLFKWSNGFSWAYSGNVTDSMKEHVKSAGGRVDGVLRFSIMWNHRAARNLNDYDAHCHGPSGMHIWYASKQDRSGGFLDVDIIRPTEKPAVENIAWPQKAKLPNGDYNFYVHCFSHHGGTDGFDAEIEFGGEVHRFSHAKNIPHRDTVQVATVTVSNGAFQIHPKLPSATGARVVWGVSTKQFHPVSVVMFSPNYWDGQTGVGNKHHFFMLPGCANDEKPNGFFNEYLPESLTPHRKVFEALGSKMVCADNPDQLSGLGFSSTKRDALVVRVDGRLAKIVF